MGRYAVHVARQAGVVALFVVAAVLGIVSGILFAYAGDLPEITALDDYVPHTITRVHAADGEVVGEFATERRVVIGYDDISPRLREAILASEDAQFDRHFGLSIPRIVMTAVRDIAQGRRAGASTLTQQLARHLFLQDYMRAGGAFEFSLERKIREAIVAIQIEKRYTKREIFTFYCNQMYLGHGAYGVEAASRLYFDKSARDLDLAEAAMLAGLFQAPERLSPFNFPDRAQRRRDGYVLQRMTDEGYITQVEADQVRQQPLGLARTSIETPSVAPYFVEEVRKHLEAKYGASQLYEAGLVVETSLDARLQRAANVAVDNGLRALDRRRGYRGAARNLVAEGAALETFSLPVWQRPFREGQIVPAVVTGTADNRILLRAGPFRGEIPADGFAWTRRTPAQLVRAGDLIEVRITAMDAAAGTLTGSLEQEPIVEGALLAIDNRTGQVRAMVGGYSFSRSKFNRATQALRQLGSAFKPIVFTAAVDRGYTPATILLDEPVSYNVGPGQPLYSPGNYDRRFEGPITLRRTLEMSRNVPTVRVMEDLTPAQVVSYARRLGFVSPMPPVLSLALGAAEASLVEVTGAYAAFANQGVRMRPFFVRRILDRDGNLLEENRPTPTDAIRADTAFVIANMLRGVVLRGTATRAAALDWPLAGKTGTTDDYTDAWFVGFDPDITVGVWVGHDEKRRLGPAETGASAALPIWIEFMREYIAGREEAPEFRAPGNIVFLNVDRATGRRVEGGTPGAIAEAFISGTQPGTEFFP